MKDEDLTLSCPIPLSNHTHVQLAHGGGGTMMNGLIETLIIPTFKDELLDTRHDGAVFDVNSSRMAFSTDSYVVSPIFFPGGDIGSLAVNGTVNDLAMCGATPRYLSVSFILEEGLPMESLWRIVQSMKQAADRAGVHLVTGDTKVVDRGKGDQIFINTSGVGEISHDLVIAPSSVRAGDGIIVSGDLGRHGTALLAHREGLSFETSIESDCAPLNHVVEKLLSETIPVHCMRDLTRGGLASALVEIARDSKCGMHIEANAIPVREDVRGACEILGLEPVYMANEGRMVVIVPEADIERTIACMQPFDETSGACLIGTVRSEEPGLVTIESEIGVERILDMLSGEQLPRIC